MPVVHSHTARIPNPGFGTFQLTGDTCRDMVTRALEVGYRHLDTAQMYDNEAAVGAAVREAGLPRDEIFLTTKVWPDRFREGDLQRSVEESLDRLGLDHVDLLLLHWPNPDVPLEETMAALDAVREQGWSRHIGVSNFTTQLLEQAVECSDSPLVANQVEYHPYLDQGPVLQALEKHGMALTAYAPLAQGRVPAEPLLEEIGKAHGKSAAQAGLRWLVQQAGVIAIPRSSSARHLVTNFQVTDFELSDDEMARISALARPDGRIISPEGLAPHWD